MPRAKIAVDGAGDFYGIEIKCRACLYSNGHCMTHILPTLWVPPGMTESAYVKGKDHWSFNGDFDLPVFGPSLNTWWGGGDTEVPLHRCHSFIGCNGAQPGQIIYLGDCTHALAGQVVDLPEFP